MFVTVNGARLYFDVEGAGLVADGDRMRAKPTLVLLHGGPGADHSIYKPAFSALSDIAQIIYYDQRGNGRSEIGDPQTWSLAQWGDDVKGLCDALGVEKPIVYGASFGGYVAQAYATRHPNHPSKLILTSTAARYDFPLMFEAFGRIGGVEAQEVATAYWSDPTPERRQKYFEVCVPLYSARTALTPVGPPDWMKRAVIRNDVAMHFNGPNNEQGRMDFRAALARVVCPTLIMAGERDPIMPMVLSETIAACLPPHLVQFEKFADAGHGVVPDAPERAMAVIREFILAA